MIILIIAMLFSPLNEKTFCDGWDEGFEAGYCHERQQFCSPPPPPHCPVYNIPDETYEWGYHRGFLRGLYKSREE